MLAGQSGNGVNVDTAPLYGPGDEGWSLEHDPECDCTECIALLTEFIDMMLPDRGDS